MTSLPIELVVMCKPSNLACVLRQTLGLGTNTTPASMCRRPTYKTAVGNVLQQHHIEKVA